MSRIDQPEGSTVRNASSSNESALSRAFGAVLLTLVLSGVVVVLLSVVSILGRTPEISFTLEATCPIVEYEGSRWVNRDSPLDRWALGDTITGTAGTSANKLTVVTEKGNITFERMSGGFTSLECKINN